MRKEQILAVQVLIFTALAGAASASESACPVPGISVRWALAYCMTRYETDDEAHQGVADCFAAERGSEWAGHEDEHCDTNLAYKTVICTLAIADGRFEGTLPGCIQSGAMFPAVVEHGVGDTQ